MKLLNILLFLMFSVMAATASEISFDQFASDHKRQYSSAAEKQKRKGIYTSNMKNIDKLNKEAALKGSSARFGVTKFADLEQAELEKNKMGFKVSSLNKKNIKLGKTKSTKKTTTKTTAKTTTVTTKTTTTTTTTKTTTPTPSTSFDWTQQKGIVSSVKDQGNCGSCWAFATAAVLESYYARKGNTLTDLSEQQLVDCNTVNAGCNGGDPYQAFYYEKINGAEPYSAYPYTAVQQTCKYNSTKTLVKPQNIGFVSDETDMMSKLTTYGPLEVAIWADPLQYYTGGILSASQCNPANSPNHAVTLVGYGSENGVPYWKIKNSWGSNWGESGYFRLQRNTNTCNIKSYPIYVY